MPYDSSKFTRLAALKLLAQRAANHSKDTSNPHSVTKSQVGLSNVPNVATNNQTPTYTTSSTLSALTSGENLSAAFGKISKAVTDLITHLADTTKHITAAERTAWNAKTSNTGTITKVQANGTDVASSGTANIPAATTSKYGVTQLSSATNSTSEALAATPKAVKTAYDLANTANSKANLANVAYGTCSTAAATAAKEITVADTTWQLKAGSIVVVKFSATNTAQNPTFNVNSTGAKSVWYNTALITTGSLGMAGTANRPMAFIYDGTQYVYIGWSIDSNTTYSNASLGQGYGTCATAEATTEKAVALSSYALTTGGFVSVKFTYAVPASATLNINSKGAKAIYFNGAAIPAGLIKAGDLATFVYNGSQYHLVGLSGSVVTAGSYGPSANAALTGSGSFAVPQVTLDATGRVTGIAQRTMTLSVSQIADITIAVSAWTANTDSATKAAYPYYADASVSGLTALDSVRSDLSLDSLPVAKAAGMASAAAVLAGTMRYYAASVPSAALSLRLTITKGG